MGIQEQSLQSRLEQTNQQIKDGWADNRFEVVPPGTRDLLVQLSAEYQRATQDEATD